VNVSQLTLRSEKFDDDDDDNGDVDNDNTTTTNNNNNNTTFGTILSSLGLTEYQYAATQWQSIL
jgi:hypothetical protein